MGKVDNVTLNVVFFDNRMQQLGLKQWWLADQIGVDRKTVGRWLTGQTKKIKTVNLSKLAAVLACEEQQLILRDETAQFSTPAQQALAAQLIEQENLAELLSPSGNWQLLEGLIRASLKPNLPISLLGQLYNYLCISAWRQSQLDKAEQYLKQALDIAEQSGHQRVLIRAKLNQATLQSFRGEIAASIASYRYCIDNEQYIDDPMLKAAALSNLGCVYQEYGDFELAVRYQQQAIDLFVELDKPFNLGIAWIGLCDALLEQGKYQQAWAACETSLQYVEKSQTKRGWADCDLFFSLILSAQQQYEQSLSYWRAASQRFKELNIAESRTCLAGALCFAGLGQFDVAKEQLATGFELAKPYPVETALLHQARFAIYGEQQDLEQAKQIFIAIGAVKRAVFV
ncbi:tetratricopeptide repeat protein [Motilimonas eburnea]|uniref:tetratricopeptide repeat protein n=1 Tax=Motilimonas eburnea TaxID=1737488 RepID=UPI001E2C66AC|nr:tetratricopeptide repeat protein [Motilimonas eburnea]MCE2571165.1 helix-turn-helix domain-containing protein [Motilimonas eburnea]